MLYLDRQSETDLWYGLLRRSDRVGYGERLTR